MASVRKNDRNSAQENKKVKQKQTNRYGGKSKTAWITAGATVCAAIIAGTLGIVPKLWKEPATSLAESTTVDRPFWHKLEEPVVVWPKKEGSKYGYTQPPKIQIAGECSECLEEDALCIQCDKAAVSGGSSSEEVENEHIRVVEKAGNQRLVAVFDSGSFINSSESYARAPHGDYNVFFKLSTRNRDTEPSKQFPFNYVYEEHFRDLSRVLATKDEFISIPGPNGGLEMRVLPGEKRVSTNLTQEFDFKTDFCILGAFTVEFEDSSDPSSLDIAVCDAWGEKLSVIFADGHSNTFSIKAGRESRGEDDVTLGQAATGVGRSIGEEKILNYFEIHLQEQRGRTRCSLYLRHNSPILEGDLPIHSRLIENLQFLTEFTHINLKLRKPGIVRLYDFEVARLQRSHTGL